MPVQVARFGDVEMFVVKHLQAALVGTAASGFKVDNKVPNPRPARLVQVRRDGGLQSSPRQESARMGVNVWAPSDQEANDTASLVRALLAQAAGTTRVGVFVKRVTTSGPSPVPEDATDTFHKYFTAELLALGSALT